MTLLRKILSFFGFGVAPKSAPEEFEEMFRLVSSQKRLDECSKTAYQAVQRKETVQPGQVHPFEGTLKAECIKADAALTAYRTEQLTKKFGEAQFFIAQVSGGVDAQISEAKAEAIERQIAANVSQNSPAVETLKLKLADQEQALKIFRGAHGISDHYEAPAQSNTLFYAGAFAIFEAIANVAFLREAFNPVVALFIALALAALNVGGNVWLGNRYRESNHTDRARARRGRRNFAYAAALIFGVGGVIAGARFYAQSKIPGAIDGGFFVESIVLLAIGIALGIMAFLKGYSMDHPFPGYGPLVRATEALRNSLQDVVESHAMFCEKLRKSSKAAHEQAKATIRSSAQKLTQTLPELTQALEEWKQQRDQIDDAFGQQQKVFKAIMAANAQNGTIYPQEIDHLSMPPQLMARLAEVKVLTEKSQTINQEVLRLTAEVDVSSKSLQEWWDTDRARNLLRWPA